MGTPLDKRFRTIAAAYVVVAREDEDGTYFLLQKRQNTGFCDGMWDVAASGHVEKGEPMSVTACREVKEEIGITVLPEDMKFIGLLHDLGDDGYSRFFGCFLVVRYSGEARIGEPDKIAELKWFKEGELPENMTRAARIILEKYREGEIFYEETGWR